LDGGVVVDNKVEVRVNIRLIVLCKEVDSERLLFKRTDAL